MPQHEIVPAQSTLRVDLFKTRSRERTTGIYLSYLNCPADPRIDARVIDEYDACKFNFGCTWNCIVKLDGTIEAGRDFEIIPAQPRRSIDRWYTIAIGVVGGRSLEPPFKIEDTLTPEQHDAIEWLLQECADRVGNPLEVTDRSQGA
jgi:hypothetical protein